MADPLRAVEHLFMVSTGFLLDIGGLKSLGKGVITILVQCKTWMSPLELHNRLLSFPKLSMNLPWFGH